MLKPKTPWVGTIMVVVATFCLLLAVASKAKADTNFSRGGILGCNGSQFESANGLETHSTTYSFYNFNDRETIAFKSISILDASGAVVYDSPVDGFPTNPSNDGFRTTLSPHQSTFFSSTAVLSAPNVEGPMQALIEWKVKDGRIALSLQGESHLLTFDASTSEEKARTVVLCAPLPALF